CGEYLGMSKLDLTDADNTLKGAITFGRSRIKAAMKLQHQIWDFEGLSEIVVKLAWKDHKKAEEGQGELRSTTYPIHVYSSDDPHGKWKNVSVQQFLSYNPGPALELWNKETYESDQWQALIDTAGGTPETEPDDDDKTIPTTSAFFNQVAMYNQ